MDVAPVDGSPSSGFKRCPCIGCGWNSVFVFESLFVLQKFSVGAFITFMAQFDSSLVCDFVGDEFEPVVGLVPSRIDVGDFTKLCELFERYSIDTVIHLAAQVGVRSKPSEFDKYVQSNLVGFCNVIECARKYKIDHFCYDIFRLMENFLILVFNTSE